MEKSSIIKRLSFIAFVMVVLAAWVAPSYSLDTAFDAQYRVRAIAANNSKDFDDDKKTDRDSWIDQRFRLGIKLTEAPVSGYIQLQMGDASSSCSATSTSSSISSGGITTTTTTTTTCSGDGSGPNDSHVWGTGGGENFDVQVRQAWLDFPAGPVGIRLGRTYASHGFLAGGMFENIADRIIISYKVSDELSGNFIHAKARDGSSSGVDTSGANDNDKNIYNLGVTWKPKAGMVDGAARVYYVRDGQQTFNASTGVSSATVPGSWDAFWLTAQSNIKPGPVNLYVSAAFLTGSSEPASGTSIDLSGFAAHIDASISPGPLKAGIVAGLGSGDDNTSDNSLDTFFAPGGASYIQSHIFFQDGENTYSSDFIGKNVNLNLQNGTRDSLSNTTWAGIYGDFKVNPDLTLGAKIANFSKTKALTGTDKSIGNEVDLTANYMIYKNLSLLAFAAWFMPDDGITGGGAAKDDTVTEYFARLQWEIK